MIVPFKKPFLERGHAGAPYPLKRASLPAPRIHTIPEEDQMRSRPEAPFAPQETIPAEYFEQPMSVGDQVVLSRTAVNRALRLAEECDFFGMCESGLWGAEKTTQRENFGELLRDGVVHYLPQNRHELLMLKDVMLSQWRLNRLQELQGRIFDAHTGVEQTDEFGLSRSTERAIEFESRMAAAQTALNRALTNLLRARQAAADSAIVRRD